MKALILGAKGNLGGELVHAFIRAGYEVIAADREELDATDLPAVRKFIADGRFDVIVNAIAWNDVDGTEDPDKYPMALKINGEFPGVLAEAARDVGAVFVHYSTDYVFFGEQDGGYAESDVPEPVNAYGRTKLAGEKAALAAGGRVFVCRTSKLFGKPGTSPVSKPSFVSVMVKLAQTKPELTIVDEEIGCPTYTPDLAEATVRLVGGRYEPGIYHLVNSGPGVTWYGFAEEFLGLVGSPTPRRPVSGAAFPRPAKRPRTCVLRNTKFPPLRPRIEALKDFLQCR